tara:strand:- start:8266 stop:8853 length:588 start_codon:yes stop_codon:yes gene_type:complete
MKKILTDCDGVLLDWAYSFEKWMKFHFDMSIVDDTEYDIAKRYNTDDPNLQKGSKFYVPRIFCNSSRIASLKPLRDSVKYVKKIYEEHGVTFDVVTSLSLDPETQKLRKYNLRKVYGDAIDRIVCLDTGEDKDEALEEWRDSGRLWVEDKPENAVLGAEMGLQSILIDHPYNRDFSHPDVTRVKNWKEVYEMIID